MKRVLNLFALTLLLSMLLSSLTCLAQVSISGKVIDAKDHRPVANADVFLSNTTNGVQTSVSGNFNIVNVKPGQYNLVVSMVGCNTISRPLTADYNNIVLGDIALSAQTIALNEVKISSHDDGHRNYYLQQFTDEFLGTSVRAAQCVIKNPGILYFDNDDANNKLTAFSSGFLEIENNMLGYRIKYQLDTFSVQTIGAGGKKAFSKDPAYTVVVQNSGATEKKVFFQGPVLFEEMKGTASQQAEWEANRLAVYQNSPMHFLRAALAERLGEEGFRVQQYAVYANPARPADSVIERKIKHYRSLQNAGDAEEDSLAAWIKLSKLPKVIKKMLPAPLSRQDFVYNTNQQGVYLLSCQNNALYVSYDAKGHYHGGSINYLYNESNTTNTLINFNGSNALFDGNGIIFDLGATSFVGAWSNSRAAELLPYNYSPPQSTSNTGAGTEPAVQLEKYLATNPTERAYLQFDKPYYAAGDTVYFAAYVTAGGTHKLSNISGVLHVDLINTKNKIDQSIKLQLDSGITHGDFALPDSLPAGNYRVRAYTQWMRNGDSSFFEKMIPVGSIKPAKIPESMVKQPQGNLKPDVQFLPEGGAMVAGIPNKIAFKAIGADGLGSAVQGEIIDESDKTITTFSSTHLGMGQFGFTPPDSKPFRARVTYANGQQSIIELPRAQMSGIALSVNNDSIPQAVVTVTANDAWYSQNKGKDYTLLIHSGNSVITLKCRLDNPSVTFTLLKRRLHTGIATVTLFDATVEPLCERLFFVQNYDQLTLRLNTAKRTYAPREQVELGLNALNRRGDAAEGHFSVSVVNESIVPETEKYAANILTGFLLTGDLKGYVEEPGYYFSDTSAAAGRDLDVLMLTQGYRGFEWKHVLNGTDTVMKYQPEKGIEIAGRVYNVFNKPVAGGAINLISLPGGQVIGSKTDEKGRFWFRELVFSDSAQFVLNATKANGKNSTQIRLFSDAELRPAVESPLFKLKWPVIDSAMANYAANDRLEQKEVATYVNTKAISLKQVDIRTKKFDNNYRTLSLAGAGFADQVVHSDKLDKVRGFLSDKLAGQFHGALGFAITAHHFDGLVVVDGVEETSSDIDVVPGDLVETVELLEYGSTAIYGSAGGHGVLIITTKATMGIDPKNVASIGVLPVKAMGFYKARTFYSPYYSNPALITKQKDLRSTIFWQPELKTGKDGHASFEFCNADMPGTYKVTVEGIDKDGNVGRQVYRYQVTR